LSDISINLTQEQYHKMKRFILSGVAISALLAFTLIVGASSTNFSGPWTLDKTKSQGLPPQIQNGESYSLLVTQTDQDLTVQTKVEGGRRHSDDQRTQGQAGTKPEDNRRPEGGVGGRGEHRGEGGFGRGGRGGFGQGMGFGTATYKLDGSESKQEAQGRRGSATFRASWLDSGKSLELTSTRSFNFQGNETTRTIRERWELADGGKTLKVKRTIDTPQGAQESTLFFSKQ